MPSFHHFSQSKLYRDGGEDSDFQVTNASFDDANAREIFSHLVPGAHDNMSTLDNLQHGYYLTGGGDDWLYLTRVYKALFRARGYTFPEYHTLLIPLKDWLRTGGNLAPWIAAVDALSDHPPVERGDTPWEPYPIANDALTPLTPQAEAQQLNKLSRRIPTAMWPAFVSALDPNGGSTIAFINVQDDPQTRLDIMRGLMLLFPPSVRHRITFNTHVYQSERTSTRLKMLYPDSGATLSSRDIVYDYRAQSFDGAAPHHPPYGRVIQQMLESRDSAAWVTSITQDSEGLLYDDGKSAMQRSPKEVIGAVKNFTPKMRKRELLTKMDYNENIALYLSELTQFVQQYPDEAAKDKRILPYIAKSVADINPFTIASIVNDKQFARTLQAELDGRVDAGDGVAVYEMLWSWHRNEALHPLTKPLLQRTMYRHTAQLMQVGDNAGIAAFIKCIQTDDAPLPLSELMDLAKRGGKGADALTVALFKLLYAWGAWQQIQSLDTDFINASPQQAQAIIGYAAYARNPEYNITANHIAAAAPMFADIDYTALVVALIITFWRDPHAEAIGEMLRELSDKQAVEIHRLMASLGEQLDGKARNPSAVLIPTYLRLLDMSNGSDTAALVPLLEIVRGGRGLSSKDRLKLAQYVSTYQNPEIRRIGQVYVLELTLDFLGQQLDNRRADFIGKLANILGGHPDMRGAITLAFQQVYNQRVTQPQLRKMAFISQNANLQPEWDYLNSKATNAAVQFAQRYMRELFFGAVILMIGLLFVGLTIGILLERSRNPVAQPTAAPIITPITIQTLIPTTAPNAIQPAGGESLTVVPNTNITPSPVGSVQPNPDDLIYQQQQALTATALAGIPPSATPTITDTPSPAPTDDMGTTGGTGGTGGANNTDSMGTTQTPTPTTPVAPMPVG